MTLNKSKGTLVKTPESKKATPAKNNTPLSASKMAKKRPAPEDDSDEELVPETLKIKKLKQMIAEDGDHSDDSADITEDDDEEVSDDDDGVSDDDEDDDVSEDDDDDDGTDDDEKDDDASVHDGDTDEEYTEKVIPKLKDKSAHSKKPEAKPSGASTATPSASSSNVMLFNIDKLNEFELKSFLNKRGVHPESIACITTPVALLGMPNETAAQKAISSCLGAAYKAKHLAAVVVSGDISKIITNKNKPVVQSDAPLTCVFATTLPKSMSKEDVVKLIDIKAKNVRLMTTGPKNILYNACYIDCETEADAKKAFEILEGHQVGDVYIKAFLKPQQGWNPITEKSFVVTNVPFTAGVAEIKKEFPTATKVESTRSGSFHLLFATKEARDKAAASSQNKTMEGRTLRIVTEEVSMEHTTYVSNLPFTASLAELKREYPSAKRIIIQKRKDGKPSGTALLAFDTEEAANKAVQDTSSKTIDGRKLRANRNIEIHPQNVAKTAKVDPPKKVETKQQKKTQLPVQVGSESEDEDDVEDENEDDEEESGEEESGEEDHKDESDDNEEEEDSGEDENEDNDEPDNDDEEMPEKPAPKHEFKQNGGGSFRGESAGFHGRSDNFRGGNRGGGFRGGNRGGGFRGGNRGGGFRGGNRGGGFRGGNRGGGFRGGNRGGGFRGKN